MNHVTLVGNIANDPELRHTPQGKAVCTFRLAVNNGAEHADFFTIVCWERQADTVHEYARKGRSVGIEGRLHYSTWETEAGKRSKVEVVAHRVHLLGNRDTPAETVSASLDDIPFG